MVKIKRLKLRPSARDKRRYFLVRCSSKKVEDVLLKHIGVFGLARAAYMRVDVSREAKWKLERGVMIGSCLVKSLDEVRAALGLEGVEILRVSGTLKGLREGC